MITWIKPNSNELTVNDSKETTAYMESIGCKRKDEKKKPVKKSKD